jgi:hypothetical protein
MSGMKIPLTQDKFTTVSTGDYEYLMQCKWTYNGVYTARSEFAYAGYFTVYMHRSILIRNGKLNQQQMKNTHISDISTILEMRPKLTMSLFASAVANLQF